MNGLKFMESDATTLPFGNQEFNMVLSFYVLHHIGSSWDKALTEINRVLKSGGYFILYDVTFSRFTTRILRRHVKNSVIQKRSNLGSSRFFILFRTFI